MTTKNPVVSVLLPVYNAAEYVQEAIQSILNQTFTDFELLIFNDGSTDDSRAIIQNIKDERIRFFDYSENTGYVTRLNEGLRLAKGIYVARMDADDIAMPERFAQQVALLEREVSVVLCGTVYETFGSEQKIEKVPLTDWEIRNVLPFHSPMGHPTVMFRKQVVDEYQLYYSEDYMPAEDYKLWYDFSKVGELRNIPDILLKYRVHQKQISSRRNDAAREKTNAIRVFQLLDQGFKLSAKEQEAYASIVSEAVLQRPSELKLIMAVMKSILYQNNTLCKYNSGLFVEFFRARWLNLVINMQQYTPTLLPVLVLPNAVNTTSLSLRMKLMVKSLIYWRVK
jgi:glycosyltransferase involved in cell wall biosynthesis